jgi:hypothetical protein
MEYVKQFLKETNYRFIPELIIGGSLRLNLRIP